MKAPAYSLGLLLVIYIVNNVDRQVMNILVEPVKKDLGLSDGQIGWLIGGSFALFYTVAGLPIARLADRANRRNIIAVALLVWSAMTMLCGMARSFPELLAARIGVGVGEAGCTPPAHSMISDTFPTVKRASAISIYSLGGPIGMLFGLAFGGYLADQLGWQAAFMVVGAPGLLLAAITYFTLDEPVRGTFDAQGDRAIEPVGTTLRFIAALPAIRHMLAGSAVQTLFLAGVAAFHSSYLVRVHGMSVTQAGLWLGLIAGVAGGLSVYTSGLFADRLGRRDLRWHYWLAAAGNLISLPFSVLAYTAEDGTMAVLWLAVATLGNHQYSALGHAVLQGLVKPRMRAVMSATALFAMNAVGFGVGPVVVGELSDYFGGGVELRKALLALIVFMFWAAAHFLLGARTYLRDLEAKNA
ncbi:MAG: MFS transporter [Deltaproteobacteria bacterium]|nr:MFS transporter [Deltaproteobacteria bacterium]